MFTLILFTSPKYQQPKCPSMNKQNRVYLYNGILSFYKREVPIHATMWMNLKSTLSERRVTKGHIQDDSVYMTYSEQPIHREDRHTGLEETGKSEDAA